MTTTVRRDRARQVLWNLRGLALLLVGPAAGVALVAAIFGLPSSLEAIAAVMFAFSLSLFALLARGEWRRLDGGAARLPRSGPS